MRGQLQKSMMQKRYSPALNLERLCHACSACIIHKLMHQTRASRLALIMWPSQMT